LEDSVQVIDLLVGVRGGQLEAEADLVMRNERVGCHRRVDATVEKKVANLVDRVGVRQWYLNDGQARGVRGRNAQASHLRQDAVRQAVQLAADAVSAPFVDAQPFERGGKRGDRRGARVQVWRRGGLEDLLDSRGTGDEGQERGVGLGEAGD